MNRPDPIAFLPIPVDTESDRRYDDFIHLFFLHPHREESVVSNELPEESDHFQFLCAACLAHLKGSMGLILAKASVMRISIPLDLSSRSCIPLPRFIRSRCHITVSSPFPSPFPSMFCLSGTCSVFILALHRFFYSS
jgi:hypothetical protein